MISRIGQIGRILCRSEELRNTSTLAEGILEFGETPLSATLRTTEFASFTALCLGLYNLDDALSLE